MTNSSFPSQIVLYLSVTRKGGAFLYQNLRQHCTIELSPKQKKADLLQSALSKNSIYVRNKSLTSRTNHIFFARLQSHILISSIVCNGSFLPFENREPTGEFLLLLRFLFHLLHSQKRVAKLKLPCLMDASLFIESFAVGIDRAWSAANLFCTPA